MLNHPPNISFTFGSIFNLFFYLLYQSLNLILYSDIQYTLLYLVDVLKQFNNNSHKNIIQDISSVYVQIQQLGMQRKNIYQSPNKLTLNHPSYRINHSENQRKTTFKLENQTNKYPQENKQKININFNQYSKYGFHDLINGQYYGRIDLKNNPSGSGIFIDDQFNFFLSNWKLNKINGLTFIRLSNQVTIYGSWINGHMNGFNIITIGQLNICIQSKGNLDRIISPLLITNFKSQKAYLVNIRTNKSNYTNGIPQSEKDLIKLQIIDRKLIQVNQKSQRNGKTQKIQFISLNQIFEDLPYKVPSHMLSIKRFLNHLAQNQQQILLKQVQQNKSDSLILSLKQIKKKQFIFKPSSTFLSQNKFSLNQTKNKTKNLGIVLNRKTFQTKSIGNFNQSMCLNGMGINFSNQEAIFGYFKEDMIMKQLNYVENFNNQNLINSTTKQYLKEMHQKQINFKNDFLYFEEVNKIANITYKIQSYIEAFQLEYSNQHQNSQQSLSFSEKSFQQKYIPLIKNLSTNIQIQKAKQLAKRPYGFIVNSRSPLRKVNNFSPNKSPYRNLNSSPSQTQTFRKQHGSQIKLQKNQRRKNDLLGQFQKRNHSKSPMNLRIQILAQNKVGNKQYRDSIQTSKNKISRDSEYEKRRLKEYDERMDQNIDTLRRDTNFYQKNKNNLLKHASSPKRQVFWK